MTGISNIIMNLHKLILHARNLALNRYFRIFAITKNVYIVKKIYLLLIAMATGLLLSAQVTYSPLIDSLKNEITESTVSVLLEELSGEVPVMIGGNQYTLESRHSSSSFNPLAAQWIYEQFEAMGLPVEYHYFNNNGENVVATITGSQFPDKQYIICAHYDDMPQGDDAPGADDNASGVVGVLETARLLKDYDLKYTVKFIAFDEEEQGLIGSNAYAGQAAQNGDDILGVLNLDMIAYDSDGDYEMSISTNTQSTPFTNDYTDVLATYDFDLSYNFITTGASDHSPFWNNGYQAILAIEDWGDFNAFYHTINDIFDNCNIPYFHQMVQAAFATMATHGMDMKMELIHEPLASGNYINEREAMLVVNTSHSIATGPGAPRLYYRLDEGSFMELQAALSIQDTFYFLVPGQPAGTLVDYYFGVQNEDASLVATLPAGGSGLNPPGNLAPEIFYTYLIADVSSLTDCSNTVPKAINDLQNLYDTIFIDQEGALFDLNVMVDITHTYTGDVEIYLISPGGVEIKLSIGNGASGNNYSNTIFDDEADLSISQGSPPYIGSYRPDEPLSTYFDDEISGNWVLRIYDNALNDDGTLNDWCLDMLYSADPVYIAAKQEKQAVLKQNYPNPFRNETNFSFELPVASQVRISLIDMMGRELGDIVDHTYPAGDHIFHWNAGNLVPGRYFYRIQTNDKVEVKSMLIIK